MSEELESCPVCGALPVDQVDSRAVVELVRNRYKLSRQVFLDDCASPTTEGEGGGEDAREAAKRIVDWDDNGRLADDEWLVERNETAIIAICRALLSSPDARREALEEAARVAETPYSSAVAALSIDAPLAVGVKIASAIRALAEEE